MIFLQRANRVAESKSRFFSLQNILLSAVAKLCTPQSTSSQTTTTTTHSYSHPPDHDRLCTRSQPRPQPSTTTTIHDHNHDHNHPHIHTPPRRTMYPTLYSLPLIPRLTTTTTMHPTTNHAHKQPRTTRGFPLLLLAHKLFVFVLCRYHDLDM